MTEPHLTADFAEASMVKRVDHLIFDAEIPDQWQQGRGAFGGLVLATMLRAVQASEPEAERVVRTVSASFAGPVLTGPARIAVREVRRGNGASTFAATLFQSNEPLAEAIVVLAKARVKDRDWNVLAKPAFARFEDALEVPVKPPTGPVFAQHYIYRSVGALPMSSSATASAAGWIVTRAPLTKIDAPEIAAYADTWWPAAYARESSPRPMATISFSLQITSDLSKLDPAAPLFVRNRADISHDGFVHEVRELWSPSGELVAINPQTFVFVK